MVGDECVDVGPWPCTINVLVAVRISCTSNCCCCGWGSLGFRRRWCNCRGSLHHPWGGRRGVVVTRLIQSAKLLYAGPG